MNIFLKEAMNSVIYYEESLSFIKSIKETSILYYCAKKRNFDVEILKVFPNEYSAAYFYIVYFFNEKEVEKISEFHKNETPNALISTNSLFFKYFSLKKRGGWPEEKKVDLSEKWYNIV